MEHSSFLFSSPGTLHLFDKKYVRRESMQQGNKSVFKIVYLLYFFKNVLKYKEIRGPLFSEFAVIQVRSLHILKFLF
jgi:hypothetical protein